MIKSFVNILKFLQNWNIGHIFISLYTSLFLIVIKEDSQGINYYSSTWKIIVIRQTRRKKISSPPPQLIHAWSSTRERLGWIITRANRLYIYNNRGGWWNFLDRVKITPHTACPCPSPKGCECVSVVECFPGCVRENYTLTVSTRDTQHAGHVRICMYTRLCT